MRDALNKLAMCTDTIVLGILLAHLLRGSALRYVGLGLVLTGAVLIVFAIRDTICALLRRCGREGNPDKVLVHMGAAVMALIGLGVASDPRGSWVFVLIMPAAVYFLGFALDRIPAALADLVCKLLRALSGRHRRR